MNPRALFRRRGSILFLVVGLVVSAVGVALLTRSSSDGNGSTIPVQSLIRSDPLAGKQFYVDPNRSAALAMHDAQNQGRSDDAKALNRIASQPSATWMTGGSGDAGTVTRVTRAAADSGSVALLVAYNIPHRDACGGQSGGGAANPTAYATWVNQMIGAIQGPAVVIVEPDAVGDLVRHCLTGTDASQRTVLLSNTVLAFKQWVEVTAVYLDAANPRWFPNPSSLTATLHESGVHFGDGVAVNVSNFIDTNTTIAWAQQLVHLLNPYSSTYGALIDTSRNGNGPYSGQQDWCNPPGRALGTNPTTSTGHKAIDAFAWVKSPGESDGQCNGGPPAGMFWPSYALGLAGR